MTTESTTELLRDLLATDRYRLGRASLHCHTRLSDGVMSPREVVDAAVAHGISTLSITDHDTMSGLLDSSPADGSEPQDLVAYAAARGITLVPGVELTCWWRWHPVHILAYGIDPSDERVARLCAMTSKAGGKRISLRWWPVQAMAVCQLALALGGVPVLAHPRFYWVNVRRMVAELVELGGLVGIETEYEYRTHHRRLQCPIWTPRRIADIAERHGLIRTGGADSHGRDLTRYRA